MARRINKYRGYHDISAAELVYSTSTALPQELSSFWSASIVESAPPFPTAARFSQTVRIPMSAGETPEIRDACPNVAGRIVVNFWRASFRRLGTVA
jgi:hypothetical protein